MGPFKRMALNWAIRWVGQLFSGKLSEDKVLGMVRHALTTLGGFLVAQGIIEPALVEPLIGVALTAFGMVWSFAVKRSS